MLRVFVPGWQRFPSSVRYGDIVKGLPVRNESCAAVYCSHVLEHLALDDARKALLNTFEILAPGGVFRLVVPDLEQLVRSYLDDEPARAAERLMIKSGLGVASPGRSVNRMLRCAFGSSSHKWLWDYPALRAELQSAGFSDVRRATLGDSRLDEFNIVERKERWDDCLGIECVKPLANATTR